MADEQVKPRRHSAHGDRGNRSKDVSGTGARADGGGQRAKGKDLEPRGEHGRARTSEVGAVVTIVDNPADERSSGGRRGRPRSADLTSTEIRAIAEFIANPVKASVAKTLNVSERTLIRMFQRQEVQEEYSRQLAALQQELWTQMISKKDRLWERLLDLTEDSNPMVRFRAITWVLSHVLSPPSLVVPPVRSEIDAALSARAEALTIDLLTDADQVGGS